MTNRTTPVGTVDEELVGTRLTKIDDRLRERLGGIEIEQFGGDNFAVWLCSQFADPDDEDEDDCGWGPTALRGYEAVIAEIHAHYTPRLEQLHNRVERLESKGHLCPNCGAFTTSPPISRVDEYPTQKGSEHQSLPLRGDDR